MSRHETSKEARFITTTVWFQVRCMHTRRYISFRHKQSASLRMCAFVERQYSTIISGEQRSSCVPWDYARHVTFGISCSSFRSPSSEGPPTMKLPCTSAMAHTLHHPCMYVCARQFSPSTCVFLAGVLDGTRCQALLSKCCVVHFCFFRNLKAAMRIRNNERIVP